MSSSRDRLVRPLRAVRRAVLRRRRILAALLTAVAVAAGLHAVATPPPATIRVTVAARDLTSGTVLSAADVESAQFSPESVPDAVAAAPIGRVLAAPLRRGEPLTDLRLVGPALTDGHPDLTAIPLRLPDAGMVDLLEVGDRIDVVAADPQGGGAEVVAADVLVLALAALDESDARSGPSGLPGQLVVIGAQATDVPGLAEAVVRAFVTFTWSSD